jgi:hypothetical protein
MTKRAFRRKAGILLDDYEDPPGQRCTMQLSAASLGEKLLPEERDQQLQLVAAGGWDAGAAVQALGREEPERLEAMLAGLANGGGQAFALELTEFVADPRVRPALVAATRQAAPPELGNLAQALGVIGGPGVREVLRERMQELLADPDTFKSSDFCNWSAATVETIAEHLLFLEADAVDAARALVRLFEHPCRLNRLGALWKAGEMLQRKLAREAMLILETALRPVITSDDAEAFTRVAPALARIDPEKVRARCVELLDNSAHEVRSSAARTLLEMRHSPSAREALLRWLPGETALLTAMGIAGELGDAARPVLSTLVARALAHDSPALRHHGIFGLNLLDVGEATRLASQALVDEPDPALRKQLEATANRT